ncbi:Glycosidase [Flavobacterium swingsii]|uniref:Glycosidase n=1 Tax=Flavobacterium swingsii TaxID=498292 RepID=A0A1I0XQ00_9FLAO|nr:alpha-amylase family glycosyl hydrolase [Flavobacterium swingsii]SFB03052.1 Glycosidase [Flavobacterium swingsii]
MKKIFIAIFLFSFFINCKKEESKITAEKKIEITPISSEMAENGVIYEANIRQYSPEGTFNAFTKDIPKLKKLGIKILWLMPINEIGIKNRKAKIDLSVDDITDSIEKQKYLGNPYSVKNYRSINPDFGTKADLLKLIKTAHKNGIYIILDWVANRTAWDHAWITQHPEYYTHDKEGNIMSPYGWKDVAELDYNNPNLRKAMFDEMKYWLTTYNIDGFRCDLAAEIPTDFWENTRAELNKIKPIFMLMQAQKPKLMVNAFDMQYGWESHYIFNEIVKGEKTAKDFDNLMKKNDSLYQKDDINMNFTSNHDENFWNGTEYERLGNATETFAALTYVMPGMPLIYSGQEYDSNKRLPLYEKDTIPYTVGNMMSIYEKLGKLKTENEALNGGKNPASYNRLLTSNDVDILAFEREKNDKKVIFIGNLSKTNKSFIVPIEGVFTDYMLGTKNEFVKNQKMNFNPWEYKILIAE